MTLEQALQQAVKHHQSGQLEQAEKLYRLILEQAPDEPAVLHLLGLLVAQRGDLDEGLRLVRRAIELLPDVAEFHANLAQMLQARGALHEAIASYRRASELKPDGAEAIFNLALLLQSQGQTQEAEEAYKRGLLLTPNARAHNNLGAIYSSRGELGAAEESYRRAVALNPRHALAQSNLAGVLALQGRMKEAAEAYQRSLALDSSNVEDQLSLGHVLESLGETAQAVECYRRCLALDPALTKARHALAMALHAMGKNAEALATAQEAVAGGPEDFDAVYGLAILLERAGRKREAVEMFERAKRLASDPDRVQFDIAAMGEDATPPPIAPADYIVALFNDFSVRFDEHMVQTLKYDAPRQLYQAVKEMLGEQKVEIADLGCGTGLSGVPFRTRASRLVGVDLAPRMIEASRRRGIYDELHVGDVTTFLRQRPAEFDLIIAADLFIYIGDLSDVFPASAEALREGGLFVFSIESQKEAGFRLHSLRRYTHSMSYLEALATKSGFEIRKIEPVHLRMEHARPVEGWAMVLQKRRNLGNGLKR
ncbi:MAG TPA: tetratricopeptide repeat protein [Tepidisphaeraceae bacterium]|jgi:predicted TPR repeat methyltransferase